MCFLTVPEWTRSRDFGANLAPTLIRPCAPKPSLPLSPSAAQRPLASRRAAATAAMAQQSRPRSASHLGTTCVSSLRAMTRFKEHCNLRGLLRPTLPTLVALPRVSEQKHPQHHYTHPPRTTVWQATLLAAARSMQDGSRFNLSERFPERHPKSLYECAQVREKPCAQLRALHKALLLSARACPSVHLRVVVGEGEGSHAAVADGLSCRRYR